MVQTRFGMLELAWGAVVVLAWTLLGGLSWLNQELLQWLPSGLVQQGALKWNLDDEVLRETLVARDGQVVHPRLRELLQLPPAAEVSRP